MGDVADFRNFMGAVIDGRRFDDDHAATSTRRAQRRREILAGGERDDESGCFVEPTVVADERPELPADARGDLRPGADASTSTRTRELEDDARAVRRELAVRAHRRDLRHATARAIAQASARCATPPATSTSTTSRRARSSASSRSAARAASGTNDKAGSPLNLLRWISPRTIKETFVPRTDFTYPFMQPGD